MSKPQYLYNGATSADFAAISGEEQGNGLRISECFYNTLQGEGLNAGVPAIFVRLQSCTLNCTWCDTDWKKGQFHSNITLLEDFNHFGIAAKLLRGHHLVFTGGSPMLQQAGIVSFLEDFANRFSFTPIVEIENECTRRPNEDLLPYISTWNNSPKLSNSGMRGDVRYFPDLIRHLSSFQNAWFKFVIGSESDWTEVQADFLTPNLIRRQQVILMPLAASMADLTLRSPFVQELAIKNSVRFSSRLQLILDIP